MDLYQRAFRCLFWQKGLCLELAAQAREVQAQLVQPRDFVAQAFVLAYINSARVHRAVSESLTAATATNAAAKLNRGGCFATVPPHEILPMVD